MGSDSLNQPGPQLNEECKETVELKALGDEHYLGHHYLRTSRANLVVLMVQTSVGCMQVKCLIPKLPPQSLICNAIAKDRS